MSYSEVSDLTDQEEKTLITLQLCAAALSLIGSSTIVFKILRNLCTTKTTSPYDRIILGLSSCDIVSSFTYGIAPFLLPSATSQRVWAFGNETSCQGLGFLMQISCIWAIWYNCILSYYYLLTVRFGIKRQVFCQRYELWMHLPGILFFPITSATGYYAMWYGEQALTMTCWVRFGDHAELVSYIFGGIPLMFTYLSLIVNNLVIYVYLKRSLLTKPLQSKHFTTDSISEDNNNQHDNDNDDDNEDDNDNNHGNNTEWNDSYTSQTNHTNTHSSVVIETKDFVSLATLQRQLTNEAATQGFLYVFSFLLTATPVFVIQVLDGSFGLEEDDQKTIYPLLVINAMLMPLQGFFNVFIYVRPTYSRFKAAHPEKSRWKVFQQALFDPNIPKLTSMLLEGSFSGAPTSARERRIVVGLGLANHNSSNSSGSSLNNSTNIKNNSKSRDKLGSNFSMSLDNIQEEEECSRTSELIEGL